MKKNILLILVILSIKMNAQNNPSASFTVSNSVGCKPFNLNFTNTSSNATSCLWDFGDGASASSVQNPTHIYFNAGIFSVTLIAFSSNGQSDTLVMNNLVIVNDRPVAAFSISNNNSCVNGNPIAFTNNSANASNYLWDFGDGTTSAQANPGHVYTSAGTYSVALIAQNATGCSDVQMLSNSIVISPLSSAVFSADTTKFCSLSHQFNFTATASNSSSYNWNFGDGTSASSVQTPSHYYSSPGQYSVSLTVINQNGCSNSLTKSNYITVSQELNPVFSSGSNAGCVPLNVSFSSGLLSTLSYHWDFGDGTSASSVQNPLHVYNDTGIYNVSLTVTDAYNCSFSHTADSLVNSNDPVKANFSASITSGCSPFAVHFTDNSTNAASRNWDFGDGFTSVQKNPIHTFSSPGNFTVTLSAHNAGGCTSTVQKLNLIHTSGSVSGFTVSDSAGCTPLTINFTDTSVNAVQWFWSFGDGTTSPLKNPVHTFNTGGFFTVKLITYNNSGCSDTLVKNNSINAIEPNISYNIPDTISSCNEITASFNGSPIGTNFWLWNFGDSSFSSQPNPVHTFTNPGMYSVSLTTQTANGCTVTVNNYNVYEIYKQNVDFNFSLDSCPNYTASFSDTSSDAASWFWDFGDGTSTGSVQSTIKNPVHTYANAGYYTVALTVTTSNGCTFSAMKNNAVHFVSCANDSSGDASAGFPGESDSQADSSSSFYQVGGCAPFTASFINPLDSTIAWRWDFGDGDTSNLKNPSHNYTAPGTYDVMLIAQHSNGTSDTLVKTDFIKVNKVNANFSATQSNSCQAGNVTLANLSSNANSYSWNFGDSTPASSAQNPFHNYSAAGNYLIKLKASDSLGCNSISVKNIYAGVTVPIFSYAENVCINDSVQFSSNLNNYFSYQWDFGDASASSVQNPVHSYLSAGNFLVSLTVFDSAGCSFTGVIPEEVTVNSPIANFNFSANTGCNTLLVSFNNLSANSGSWLWNFGDSATSTLKNPSHIYANPGTYSVSLTAEKNGCTNEFSVPNAITVFESVADFYFTQNTLCLPVTANFSDSSMNAVSWLWNFGDGTPASSVQNPVHVFTNKPAGNISLTITDVNGCTTTVSKPNIEVFSPAISASATKGCDSLSVNFTDQTIGAVSWQWSFGDGSTASSAQNPAHFYADSGSYTVTLVAEAQDGCKDTVVEPGFISVYKVIADFNSPSALWGCNPLLVNFTDNSINATQWQWNFGDGASSTQKNPFHIYTLPNMYDASLIASNSFGCADTIIKNNFINVTGPVASFSLSAIEGCEPMPVQFSDSSFHNAINLTWYFGDGDTSHSKNPLHVYDADGSYSVSLLAEDTSGCSSFFTYPQNIVVHPAPQAAFPNSDSVGCEPLNLFFSAKTKDVDSTSWNFGDGAFSVSLSENHTYHSAGEFYPFLVANNNFGCADTFYYHSVHVYPSPVADFTAAQTKGCSPLAVNFTNQSTNLNNAVFQWNFGNEIFSADTNPSVTYADGGLYDVSLIVTNEFGCADTMTKNSFIMAYDHYPPAPSEVVVVTVASDTSVQIVWKESNAVDFDKYILYRKNNITGQYLQIAVFSDISISNYSDNHLNTLNNSYCYKLQTADFCGNLTELDSLTEYCTINVTAKADSAKINVQWTPYIGCNVSNYEILRVEKGKSNFETIGEVDGGTLNYNDTSWHCYAEYSYKIIALNVCRNPVASFSDTSFAKPDENIFANQKVEIVRSTVINNSAVITEWKSPVLAPEKVAGYKIFRSPGNLKFEYLASAPAAAHSYIDNAADVSKQNYYYKVVPVNTCEIEAMLSNNASSILLEAERKDYEVKLKWTPYKHWENGVEQYIIEKMDENGNWQIIKTVSGNITEEKDLLVK